MLGVRLFAYSYGGEFEFFAECFRVVDSSAINKYGLLHVFYEVFRSKFFEFVPFSYEYGAVCVFEAVDC